MQLKLCLPLEDSMIFLFFIYKFLSFVGRAERLREGVPPPGPQQADETQDEGGEEVLQPHLHGDAGV